MNPKGLLLATTCCVYCGKPAKFWSGHVKSGRCKYVAGWCSRRHEQIKGFRGIYQEWMPLQRFELDGMTVLNNNEGT